MSGKPKKLIDINILHSMYRNYALPMDEIALFFGYSRRQLVNIISQQRKLNPEKWPKRYPKPVKVKEIMKRGAGRGWKN